MAQTNFTQEQIAAALLRLQKEKEYAQKEKARRATFNVILSAWQAFTPEQKVAAKKLFSLSDTDVNVLNNQF